MKCQILFSWKSKKNISKCRLLKILPRVLSVNVLNMINRFIREMDFYIFECGHIHYCKEGFQSKINNRAANYEDPDETAHDDPSYPDLHSLQWYLRE